MIKVKKDLTGMTFGRLTVLRQAEDHIYPNGKRIAKWLCECSCSEHNLISVMANNLKSGCVKSCGCLRKEIVAEYNQENKKKYNEYNYDNEYGIGYCSNTGNQFYFDWEDFDTIKEYCWNEHIKTNGYHSLETFDEMNKKNVSMMHILDCKGYDHVNRNPLDNRRKNLRKATQKENTRNKSKQKNNISGITGVGYMKKLDKWRARITVDDKSIYLGLFENKEDAICTRLKAEKEYFGEFAPQQHLFTEYGID